MCGSRPLPDVVTRSTGMGASLPGSAFSEAVNPLSNGFHKIGIDRAEVRSARRTGVVGHRRRGRRAAPEVFWIGEVLPDQDRGHRPAVAIDQAAVGLAGEDRLRDAGNRQRIDDPRENVRTMRSRNACFSCFNMSLLKLVSPHAERVREAVASPYHSADCELTCFLTVPSLHQVQCHQDHVDQFDADKRHDQAAEAEYQRS